MVSRVAPPFADSQIVATIADRDAIPVAQRVKHMTVFVEDRQRDYRLYGPDLSDNATWVPVGVGSATLTPVFGGFYNVPVFYVETPGNGGDDINGDGSSGAPFATMQRAFDAIPSTPLPEGATRFVYIRVGEGDFEYEALYSGVCPFILIQGSPKSTTMEAINITGASSLEPGKQATRQVPCDPFTTVIATEGQWFVAANPSGEFAAGYVCRPSTSPTLRTPGFPSVGSAYLYELGTRFTWPSSNNPGFRGTKGTTRIYVYSAEVDLTGYTGAIPPLGPGLFRGGRLVGSPGWFLGADSPENGSFVVLDSYLNVDVDTRNLFAVGGSFSRNIFGSKILYLSGREFYAAANVWLNTQIRVASTIPHLQDAGVRISGDFEGCANPVNVYGARAAAEFLASSLDSCAYFAKAYNGATLSINGAISGATTGVPVVLSGGARGYNFDSLDGVLTNGTTPGDEIQVGGAPVQGFADLPIVDIDTLSRAD